MLNVKNISKKFNTFELKGISFKLPKGNIMGLIGPNGAGKTTTIKLILNILKKQTGEIIIFNKDLIKNEIEIKEHIKILIYIIAISLFIVISSKSLVTGIITTMTFITIRSTSVLFQVEEKNKLHKFYGFIPIKKSELVIGRYVFISLGGLAILIFSLLIQSLILIYIGVSININECFLAFVFGLATYLFAISTQLPGFYKFGSINGSAFSYIPLIFFAISFYLTGAFDNFGIKTFTLILNNLNLVSLILLSISILFTLISLLTSIYIYKSKE